jgi:hypothetical protein
LTITLSNPSTLPMRLTGEIPPQVGLVPSIGSIDQVLAPGTEETLVIHFTAAEGTIELPLEDFIRVSLTASVRHNGRDLSAPATHRHILDWVRPLRHYRRDADPPLALAEEDLLIDVSRPNFIREDWDWRGPQDGSFQFAVALHDDKFWFFLQCIDDHVHAHDGSDDTPQDRFLIQIAGPEGSVDLHAAWKATHLRHEGKLLKEAPYTPMPTSGGGSFAFLLPLDWLRGQIGEDLGEIRLNVAWTDVDDPLNVKPSVLWWQPPWDSAADFEGSGTFRLVERNVTP